MNLQVLRPDPFWLWVQADEPFQVPHGVLEVPGVRYTAPEQGYTLHRCEVPWTAWNVPSVVSWLEGLGYRTPELVLPWQPNHANPLELLADLSIFDEATRKAFAGLYKHQVQTVDFMCEHPQMILGSEVGTGKTRCALLAAHLLRKRLAMRFVQADETAPVLIIGPKYLRGVWRNELEALGLDGAETFFALKGVTPDAAALEGKQWIFSHYDVLHAWWSQILLRKPAVAILDEAHLVRNARTRRGRAASLAMSITPCRFLLTGTPVENRVGDFWNLLDLACGKWTWGSPRVFRERYAGATVNAHGGLVDGPVPTHADELRQRLSLCYLRRTKKDAGVKLPPLTRQVVEVELEPREMRVYQELCTGLDPAVLIRQIKAHRASKATIEWLGKLRKLTAKAKERATIEEITSALEQGEHVLCFTWQKKTAEAIAHRALATLIELPAFPAVRIVHGEHATNFREAAVRDFQRDGGLLVATLDSLGVGVTLHKASLVVMHDLDWVPSRMLQAEARAHRIGLDHPVLSKWMVARGTLDELLVKALLKKAPRIAETVGDTEPATLADLLGETLEEQHESFAGLLDWARGA